jgi:hypothetical protein
MTERKGREIDGNLQAFFQQISAHLAEHPADLEVVITECHAVINKYDPDIAKNPSSVLPLANPDFRPRVKAVREKIFEAIGAKKKIPDLRFQADTLSREASIPLPNSTRKNNEALIQWFETHWRKLEPHLQSLKVDPS